MSCSERELKMLAPRATGSAWNFAGRATAGPLAGQELEPVQVTKDFWFDWRNYHPETTLRRRGL